MYSRDYREASESADWWSCLYKNSAPKIQLIHFPWFSRLFLPTMLIFFINKYHLWNSLEPTHSREKMPVFILKHMCSGQRIEQFLLLVFFKVHPLHSKHISAQYSFLPIKLCSFWFYSSNNQKSLKMQASDLKLTHNIWIHILDKVNMLADAK